MRGRASYHAPLEYEPPVPFEDPAHFLTVDLLDLDHLKPLDRALRRILQSGIAETTYAEILDGLPTQETYQEMHWARPGHPANEHETISPGARERVHQFRADFDLAALSFPSSPLLAFQDAPIGSKSFHLRLLELLAISCHQIAVYLFQLPDQQQKHEEYVRWRDEPGREENRWDSYRAPSAFAVHSYDAVEQYPNGIADCVGYWAEVRIFGGVVVFDRGASEKECKDVYLHGPRRGGPRTIFPPTEQQYTALVHFLLRSDGDADNDQDESKPSCPLPMLSSLEHRWRWDAWEAIANWHIFRDKWERKISKTKPPAPCAQSAFDWPEFQEDVFLLNAMYDSDVDEAKIAEAEERLKQITPSSPLWPYDKERTWAGF